jgi:hypothetical protein
VWEQEQSANTVRQAIAREEPGVWEHKSEQRAAAREVPGVREQEQSANTVRQAIARDKPGVQEHETELQAEARQDPAVCGVSTWVKTTGSGMGKENLCDGVQVRKWGLSISSALWLMEW